MGGHAKIFGCAQVSEKAWISGNIQVFGNAHISGLSQAFGDVQIYENARVFGVARVYGTSQLCGDAWVVGAAHRDKLVDVSISGNIKIDHGVWSQNLTIDGKSYMISTTLEKVLMGYI